MNEPRRWTNRQIQKLSKADVLAESEEAFEAMKKLLADHSPPAQGMAVARAAAMWIMAHNPLTRDANEAWLMATVEKFKPEAEQLIRETCGGDPWARNN